MANILILVAVLVVVLCLWYKFLPQSFKAFWAFVEKKSYEHTQRERARNMRLYIRSNEGRVKKIIYDALNSKGKYLSVYDLPTSYAECEGRAYTMNTISHIFTLIRLTCANPNNEQCSASYLNVLMSIFESYFKALKCGVYLTSIDRLKNDGTIITLYFSWIENNDIKMYELLRIPQHEEPPGLKNYKVPEDEDFKND